MACVVHGLQTIQAFEVKTAPSTSPTSPSSPITVSSGGLIDKEALLELQQVFLETFALPSFQRKLREASSTATRSDVSLWELLEQGEAQRLEKYGMEASLLELKELSNLWKDFETDAEVYVNRMAIEESLGLSQVLPAEVEERPTPVDRGSSTPLSKQSVKRLLKSLLRSFSEPDFQEAIEKLQQTADASPHPCRDQGYYQLPGRAALAFPVQEQLLPCFGLPGSRQGVQQMIARCACFLEDEEVVQLMDSVNMKLGMSPSAAARFRTLAMELK
ncbi:Uncharacterized protein SCF082_LOCUS34763 [Durusdinium trenchii]|uniref:Uncharacterized protein n=1 Tax=Durusdinium trenchii TaxID=1381693 RepID=A0ABP0I397_9DINO